MSDLKGRLKEMFQKYFREIEKLRNEMSEKRKMSEKGKREE